jgi:hypothetical protein
VIYPYECAFDFEAVFKKIKQMTMESNLKKLVTYPYPSLHRRAPS